MVVAGAAVFIAGNAALPLGGVRPLMDERLDVESWPVSRWFASNTMPLV
jgi:hypothetical protein